MPRSLRNHPKDGEITGGFNQKGAEFCNAFAEPENFNNLDPSFFQLSLKAKASMAISGAIFLAQGAIGYSIANSRDSSIFKESPMLCLALSAITSAGCGAKLYTTFCITEAWKDRIHNSSNDKKQR